MDLYLIRHAIAYERNQLRWPDDAERPLTPQGAERFRRAARGLRALAPHVDLLLSSPFIRAWETAEILAEVTGWPEPVEARSLSAGRPSAGVVAALKPLAPKHSSIALVGHEPDLSRLAALLLAGDANRAMIEMKKGAVACLKIDGAPGEGAAWLQWHCPARVLRALASS